MKFSLLGLILLLSSCEYGTSVTITNNTAAIIDSIIVSTGFYSDKLENIGEQNSKTIFLNFQGNTQKGDGIISLEIFKNGKIRSSQFGYFSNGIPPDDEFFVEIFNDTIIIRTQN